MNEWCYKGTGAKADSIDTPLLATQNHFICRSAHDINRMSRAKLVDQVEIGDVLHFYYVNGPRVNLVGSFEIITQQNHSTPHKFGTQIAGTALWEVTDKELVAKLIKMGYDTDSVWNFHMGWLLKRRSDITAPSYSAVNFGFREILKMKPE